MSIASAPMMGIRPPLGLPRWQYTRVSPKTINEGDAVTFSVKCSNPVVGAKVVLWMTGGKSMGSSTNWVNNWDTIIREELERNGCTYLKLSGSTSPAKIGTVSWLITIGPDYVAKGGSAGIPLTFSNLTKRNRKNDATNEGDIRGGVNNYQILLQGQTPTTTFGSIANGIGGSFIDIRDTSRKPTGYPSIRVATYGADGVSVSPGNLQEGDTFKVVIVTEFITPGTQLKMYVGNDGQDDITPSFRNEIYRAATEAGCDVYVPRFDKNNPGDYFKGGTITFLEGYDNSKPITMTFTVKTDTETEATEQFDILSLIVKDGDSAEFDTVTYKGAWSSTITYVQGDWVDVTASGRKFIYYPDNPVRNQQPPQDETTFENSYWREYRPAITGTLNITKFFKDIPPRYWEIRAVRNGANIDYTIQSPSGSASTSVDLSSINPPPGFDQALAQLNGVITYSNGTLISNSTSMMDSQATFSVPYPSNGSGKHSLRLSNSSSYITIEDACVYLSPITLPTERPNYYGVNLAGGEFGDIYTATGERTAYNGGRYYYPSKPETSNPHEQIDYFWNEGVRVFRLPIKWERIQPELFGDLYYGPDVPFTSSNDQDMRRIIEIINYITSLGGIVLLDLHNYMGYTFGVTIDPETGKSSRVVGKVKYDSPLGLTVAALSDVWVKLANVFADNPKVWFGLMNEPSGDGATATRTAKNMQSVNNAIRSRTPALNKTLWAGSSYSNAKRWVLGGVAAAFDDAYDPANNFAFEPHNYLDSDQSGTKGSCVVQLAAPANNDQMQLKDLTEWCRSKGFKYLLGEFAGGNPATEGQEECGRAVPATYQYMKNNSDVCIGWTTWAGGFPTSYPFALDPSNRNYVTPTRSGSMAMLFPFLEP